VDAIVAYVNDPSPGRATRLRRNSEAIANYMVQFPFNEGTFEFRQPDATCRRVRTIEPGRKYKRSSEDCIRIEGGREPMTIIGLMRTKDNRILRLPLYSIEAFGGTHDLPLHGISNYEISASSSRRARPR
jgi:hypothetical protein